MSKFKFKIGAPVGLVLSGEMGIVIGQAKYAERPPLYYVRFKAADGRQCECWWGAEALMPG